MKIIMLLFFVTFILTTKIVSQNVYKKVFVIGNSLTIGFGTHGMASSNIYTDYYYKLQQVLLKSYSNLSMSRMRGNPWEIASDGINDGNSVVRLNFLNNTVISYINGTEDLIIIQLGDNVNSVIRRKSFSEDAVTMINWFKVHCPDSRILWVYGWYGISLNMPLLKEAISSTGKCELVDITQYSTDEIYKSAIGNQYIDSNGNIAVITSAGVASHPGDLGMEMIAYEILRLLANDSTGVINTLIDFKKKVVLKQIFDLYGREIHKPNTGINIIKETYNDARIKVYKVWK